MMMKPWVCLSSSSGETFRNVYSKLRPETQKSLIGFFVDRECKALDVARDILGNEKVFCFSRPNFEKEFLAQLRRLGFSPSTNDLKLFLCGFFGILSTDFLRVCPGPILNTHPSLLPAFPGLDEKVHKKAAEDVSVSGFSVHLVTEKLDGGPILFQHPVWMDPRLSWEQNRARVRVAEQKFLPSVLERYFASNLTSLDREKSSRELRKSLGLFDFSFVDKEF
jgi:phosphoribosylglycinamide formyltransferase-1